MATSGHILLRFGRTATLVAVMALAATSAAFSETNAELAGPPTTTHGIQPIHEVGNLAHDQVVCPEGSTLADQIDDPPKGTSAHDLDGDGADDLHLTVRRNDVPDGIGGPSFDFVASDLAIAEIHVKGGPDRNHYTWSPAVAGDTYVHAPINLDNRPKFYGLSHLSVCFVEPAVVAVAKFIDADEDGVDDDPAPDPADLAGWTFDVVGPAPDADVVCHLTTDVTGTASCEVVPGRYTVIETNGGMPLASNGAPTIVTTDNPVTVVAGSGGDGAPARFGNTCRIAKTFVMPGVPDGATPFAIYDTSPDGDPTDDTVVPLTQTGSTWSNTTDHLFEIGDTIEVGFGNNLGAASEERLVAGTETFLASDGYPSCQRTNIIPFSPAEITIQKLKDVTADGVDGGDVGFDDWEFTITGPGHESGTTVTTANDGMATLGNLAPGDYTIVEALQANWDLTGIVGGTGACDPSTPCVNTTTVSTSLTGPNSSVAVTFANAPLSDLDVRFFDLTGHTDAQSISCVDGEGDPVGSGSSNAEQPEATHEVSGVQTGTYVCRIVIIDP